MPKCSWNAAASKSGNAPDHVSPSMSDGSSPASAIARSTASAPISRAVRPDAFVYAVSPMPTIATSSRTSSSSDAWPQSLTGARRYSLRHGEFGDGMRDVEHAARRGVGLAHDRAVEHDPPDRRRARGRVTTVQKSNSPSRSRSKVAWISCGGSTRSQTDRSLHSGTVVPKSSANAGVAASTVVSRLTIATASSSETSSCSHSPARRSRRGRSTRSARRRAAPRSAHAGVAPLGLGHRGTDARRDGDDEVAVVERVRPARRIARHEHRPSDDAGADDRRARPRCRNRLVRGTGGTRVGPACGLRVAAPAARGRLRPCPRRGARTSARRAPRTATSHR